MYIYIYKLMIGSDSNQHVDDGLDCVDREAAANADAMHTNLHTYTYIHTYMYIYIHIYTS